MSVVSNSKDEIEFIDLMGCTFEASFQGKNKRITLYHDSPWGVLDKSDCLALSKWLVACAERMEG